MWCRSSLSGRADALYVVNDALGSFLLRASEVIDQVPMSACVQVFGRRDDGLTTDCGGRRPKSAKARSRGKLGTGGATGAMGI
jgi:hypothetical protein